MLGGNRPHGRGDLQRGPGLGRPAVREHLQRVLRGQRQLLGGHGERPAQLRRRPALGHEAATSDELAEQVPEIDGAVLDDRAAGVLTDRFRKVAGP